MADFNNVDPPKIQTDPKGLGANRDYPRHMHCSDGSYVVVNTDAEKQAARDAGYTDEPTHETWTDWGGKPALLPAAKPAKAKR